MVGIFGEDLFFGFDVFFVFDVIFVRFLKLKFEQFRFVCVGEIVNFCVVIFCDNFLDDVIFDKLNEV